jgi:hypothetical protein
MLMAGLLLWTSSRPAWSDDRDLLREASGNPYVFIVFDTSGSMNSRPGDTEPIAAADDPESKFYQAKSALYQVMSEFDDLFFGFSTFNQDNLRIKRKQWIYRPAVAPVWPTPTAILNYPTLGQGYAFGGGVTATNQASCTSPTNLPASGTTRESITGFPRTGDLGDRTYSIWLRESSRIYFVETRIVSGTLGSANLSVELRRRRLQTGTGKCGGTPPGTSQFDLDESVTLQYDLVTDAILWDQVDNIDAGGTCNGWEPNSDSPVANNKDQYRITGVSPAVNVNVKYPTVIDPLFPTNRRFDTGDMIPLSWNRQNKQEILERLAPNLRLGETVPDFRIARYFEDFPTGNLNSSYALKLLNNNVRPLMAEGSTPLGNSVEAFRTWYAGCAQGTCPKDSGWKDIAAVNDPDWACRRKYLIVLTDGDETCDNADGACSATLALRSQEGVTTFVIAFGLPGGSNVLTCMAVNGGSGAPVLPQDQTALLQALRDIFGAIREQSRAFASAAVPGVQAEVQDKIYLTNFTPLNKESVWDGHIDAYLKPLPLTANGLPDRTKNCAAGSVSGCRVWDAGEKLVLQAPTEAEVNQATPNFKLGAAGDQRRFYYTEAQATSAVPNVRRLLLPPSLLAEKLDLWAGLGIPQPDLTKPAEITAADQKVKDIIKFTLKRKESQVDDPNGALRDITYVLGDVFHSNPTLLSTPNRFRYFSANLNTQGGTCEDGDPGYRCFMQKHRLRRKMLLVGGNDSQLHVFDAGVFRGDPDDGSFDNGTGREIFSYVPRPLLPKLTRMADSATTTQDWGVDGTVQPDDVFIDPRHAGIPTPLEREWRSVVVSGFREGGKGYFALDLTQPDHLDSDNVPQPINGWVPSCWNGGSVADCGSIPFGSVLWNFTDVTDEDNNGAADLGDTWSTPNTGRIKVIDPDDSSRILDKYVAVFGGGMDPSNLNQLGNWLYMVDIETGKILYKRLLVGSAPSDPAAVDTDQDGYLDTVYIGTTAGYLYKARIGNAAPLDTLSGRVTDASWEPFTIFDTLQSDTNLRAPIYFPPSVIFVSKLGKYALGFGTGNREDLWEKDGLPGRFYLLLDESFTRQDFLDAKLPRKESQYFQLDVNSAANPGTDFLLRPATGKSPGWYLRLDADERMITKAFALSGIVIFTSFDPKVLVGGGGGGNGAPVCARAGESNIFIVYTNNGDPLDANNATDATLRSRFKRVPEFVSNPFVESSGTKNPPCDPSTNPNCPPPPVPVCKNQAEVTKTLTALFPSNCKFANYTQNIQTIQSDEGLVCIAPVPLCIIEKNWREF